MVHGAVGTSPVAEMLEVGGLAFRRSRHGLVDSSHHTFLDLAADPRIDRLSFADRTLLLDSYVTDLRQQGHYPYKRALMHGCQAVALVEDPHDGQLRQLVHLASNDYLGLSQHPRTRAAAHRAIEEHGLGTGGSPMLSGTTAVALELERALARIKGCERALTFSSGYAANVGVVRALARGSDLVIHDRYAHASLLDGALECPKVAFSHNDPRSLEVVLAATRGQHANRLVVLDGVYSMDGDIARLPEIVEIAHREGAWVLVDEAHATGVLGAEGHGTLEHFNLRGQVDVITGTLSKALGSVGGFVAGSRRLINALEPACRSYMFSTAPFIPAQAAALEAIHVIEEEPALRRRLWHHIDFMRQALQGLGFDLGQAETAILPLVLGDAEKVKAMTALLNERGVFVNGVLYPAVPRNQARVRLSLNAALDHADLERAVHHIAEVGRALGVIPAAQVDRAA